MLKSFSAMLGSSSGAASGQLKLRIFLVTLLMLNAVAFYFYFDPPGGSQQDLAAQDQQIRNQINAMNVQGAKLQLMASRVETGSSQIADFQKKYFLPQRIAYGAVIEEIQRMAKISGLQERDAGFSEEPIEGTADLSLLNIKANYEGNYPSLMRFLYETDRSPMLLMLDSLTAAPERNGNIVADIRFQVVIQDRPVDEAKTTDAGPDSYAKVQP
jgi:Tfp pilus assembly protein PilO